MENFTTTWGEIAAKIGVRLPRLHAHQSRKQRKNRVRRFQNQLRRKLTVEALETLAPK